MLFTSRFSNPELKTNKYTAVRISLGVPKWPLGYSITGAIRDLMPYGLFNKYSHEEFVERYTQRLDRLGVKILQEQIQRFKDMGKPVVLLCFEDVRVEGQTCHRTTFAKWWTDRTGEAVEELPDPSTPKGEKEVKAKPVSTETSDQKKDGEQLSLFR